MPRLLAPVVLTLASWGPSVAAAQATGAAHLLDAPIESVAETETVLPIELVVPGAIMLVVTYLDNVIFGIFGGAQFGPVAPDTTEWNPFRVASIAPIAGPWAQLALKPTAFDEDWWGAALITSGLVQALGAILLVVGTASPRERPRNRPGGWSLTASAGPTAASIRLTVAF